jgi:hypothetical protein
MCQVSLAGYAVGGAFLSLAYFDLLYDIVIIVVILEKLYLSKKPATVPLTSPAAAPAIGGRAS